MKKNKQLNKKSKLDSIDVADYFLTKIDENSGDLISNLKLQKLVYYAQGFNLAMFGKPLFHDTIEAWMYGPVIPDVYNKYKENGDGALPVPKNVNLDKYSSQTKELLDEVYNVYGQYSAWVLSGFTHNEPPYKNAWKRKNKTIIHKELKNYFITQLHD